MKWFFIFLICALIAIIVAAIWTETEAYNYVSSHECEMTTRTEGYYSTQMVLVGKVLVPQQIWHGPRGYYRCTTGEGRWLSVP